MVTAMGSLSANECSRAAGSPKCFPRAQWLAKTILFALCLLSFTQPSFALGQARYVEAVHRPGSFVIAQGRTLASIYVDPNDYAGVARAASDLQADIARVTGRSPRVAGVETGLGTDAIVVFAVSFQAFSSPRVHHQYASIEVRHHYTFVDCVQKRSNMLNCQIRARRRHLSRICCGPTIHASATPLYSGKFFPMACCPSLQSPTRLSMVNAFRLHNLGNP